jgi:hypothetical protein
MFESGEASIDSVQSTSSLPGVENHSALPPSYSAPASAYTSPAGSWRDTNDVQPLSGSVTDSTTKLLQKEEENQ